MSLATAYEEIDDAIHVMVSRGWTIVPGKTCDLNRMTCCPLAAVRLVGITEGGRMPTPDEAHSCLSNDLIIDWAERHGLDSVWFMAGFDDLDDDIPSVSTDLALDTSFDMGREFRRRYVEEPRND